MVDCMERHPLFERIPDESLKEDICFKTMFEATEEGQKVTRQGGHNQKGNKWPAVFRRLPNPEWFRIRFVKAIFRMLSRLLPARHLVRLPILTIKQARPFSASNIVYAPVEKPSGAFDVEKVYFC